MVYIIPTKNEPISTAILIMNFTYDSLLLKGFLIIKFILKENQRSFMPISSTYDQVTLEPLRISTF